MVKTLTICQNMEKTDLFKILDALENPKDHEVVIKESVTNKQG